MTAIRSMISCHRCQVYWAAGSEPMCDEPGHTRVPFDLHVHRSTLALPDGTTIVPVSFDVTEPYVRGARPDYGVYLDERWKPPWPHEHLPWPDLGLPEPGEGLAGSLRRLLDLARRGHRVEVGCLGGHGRTGTALACLAILTGSPAASATEWVRAHYCPKALETPEQEAFVVRFRS